MFAVLESMEAGCQTERRLPTTRSFCSCVGADNDTVPAPTPKRYVQVQQLHLPCLTKILNYLTTTYWSRYIILAVIIPIHSGRIDSSLSIPRNTNNTSYPLEGVLFVTQLDNNPSDDEHHGGPKEAQCIQFVRTHVALSGHCYIR